MAHGTPDPSNAYYAVMQDRLDALYGGKVMIYTVEGWPRLENVIPKLKEKGVKNVNFNAVDDGCGRPCKQRYGRR